MKTAYRIVRDHWQADSPAGVEKVRVLSRPDENGRCRIKGPSGAAGVHEDWLFKTPEEAIENERRRLTEAYERKIAQLDALLKGKP